ncbi:hypothetical protein LU674_004215 [Pseudomonas alloputida]|uniref:Uncharacterized protein n=1 Tax=Pseudomonas alloputida TaxID=1940621 RepID=A0AAW7HGW9_9PSED|nr:hypothetical protein [Pseudomonas alloputida]MCE0861720.1 hypothetical protein [Pseudomonas alloputida]MCE0867918.1 hypothetical protein [Pseudomonas alloputida]MCE0889729.1 hypothetical protein [Pseudomonas alloputida]MCE1045455.1 hypothetical protein [Pseudomonas alloputida]MCE1091821.1 hypothetical protein [Pseudomonas alloputida]
MISYRYIFLFGKVLFGKLIALCRRFGLVLWGFSKLLLLLSVVWLLVAIVITPTWAPKKLKTPNPMVCGKISGVVYELPRKYVIYWPEYEGKSSWEPGFTNNKKGCGANLLSLYMAMSWPEMQPVSYGEATSFSFDGISVAIEPWPHGEAGLRKQLQHYLRETPAPLVQASKLNEDLGLNFLEGVDSAFPNQRKGFFWLEAKGRMQYIGYCNWVEHKANYSRCYLEFLMPGDNAIVNVEFLWGRLGEWHNIVLTVGEFFMNAVKYGVDK